MLSEYALLERKFITKLSEKNQLLGIKSDLEDKIASLDIESLEKGSLLLRKLSETQRVQACLKLQELCTYALQYSLGSNYEMQIEMSTARGKPSADAYVLKTDTGLKTSPLDANGGGVVDIISMALRLVTMQVFEPFIDGPIILDEPYKMVSKEFVPMVSELISRMSEDFGRQIILSTHNKFLSETCSNQITVYSEDGQTKIREKEV